MNVVMRDLEQVIWVEGWGSLLLCWQNGFISVQKGHEGRELFARLEKDPLWVRGVNGRRLIRRGFRAELVRRD